MTKNLLAETLEKMKNYGKKPEDVLAVVDTVTKTKISWKDFDTMARDVNYYSGFGSNKISLGIQVIGRQWKLARREYDGAEWWVFEETINLDDYVEDPKTFTLMEGEGW